MCDVIDRLELLEIDIEQLEQVLKKRPGPMKGKWSEVSISLMILGVVEDEWKQRLEARTT